MDNKVLLKNASERITQLDQENADLRKEAADIRQERDEALKKVAYYEREKKVDHILDILIDEKNYFPTSARQEKKAYLMDENTNLDDFMKMAGELEPRELGMFFEPSSTAALPANREEAAIDKMINKLAQGLG